VPADEKSELMTAAQKAELEAELAELEGPRRAHVVEAIKTARAFGDLSENWDYHAARREQGMLERRITVVRDRLHRAVVVAEGAGDTVGVGSTVEVEDEAGERLTVEISGVGGVSPESPLGRALLGRKVGDAVDVEAPRGSWKAVVVAIR
jgi:transcription elongation factor GreA